jgi:putative drug exporter of the RND superfamily
LIAPKAGRDAGVVFARLGRFCARRHWLVLLCWLLFAVVGVVAAGPVFGRLSGGGLSGRFESVKAYDILSREAQYGGRIIGLVDDVRVSDPRVQAAVLAATRDLNQIPHVGRAVDPMIAPRAGLLAADGRAGLVVVDLDKDLSGSDGDAAVAAVTARLRALERQTPGGATVSVGGDMLLEQEVNEQIRRDTEFAEVVSLPLTLVVMVVIFGGFLAAGLPLLGALASVAGAFVCLLGFSTFLTLDPNAVPVTTLLGLAISIDYALLIVNRFREERIGGSDVETAIERTAATAGRTIAFSAVTVAICLAGLFLFDDPTFRAMGSAGVAVVAVAVLVGLTLTPALLGVVGGRIRLGRAAASDHGFFSRVAGFVQRRPWPIALGVAVLLLLTGLPLLSVRLQSGGAELLPESLESVRVQRNVQARFPAHATDPVTIVAQATPAELDHYVAQVRTVLPAADVAAVAPAEQVGTSEYSKVDITPAGTSQGEPAHRLVDGLRANRPAFQTWVAGGAALVQDFTSMVLRTLPWAFVLIAVAVFVLLFLMTGSVLVPIKALVMNTVSLGATFGALVWVFQDGHLETTLGFRSPGGIETWVPVLAFAFAFGLSMDYEVFLLARIKELYDGRIRNDDAVRLGLQRSGRIITSAALLMLIVFAGFAAGKMLGIKEMGFALAIAVVVDATLVRCLLVPATMTLLGDMNWWAPRRLRRAHTRFGLREAARQPEPT